MAERTYGNEMLHWRAEYDELRDAVIDFARGVITLEELVELAGGRRP